MKVINKILRLATFLLMLGRCYALGREVEIRVDDERIELTFDCNKSPADLREIIVREVQKLPKFKDTRSEFIRLLEYNNPIRYLVLSDHKTIINASQIIPDGPYFIITGTSKEGRSHIYYSSFSEYPNVKFVVAQQKNLTIGEAYSLKDLAGIPIDIDEDWIHTYEFRRFSIVLKDNNEDLEKILILQKVYKVLSEEGVRHSEYSSKLIDLGLDYDDPDYTEDFYADYCSLKELLILAKFFLAARLPIPNLIRGLIDNEALK